MRLPYLYSVLFFILPIAPAVTAHDTWLASTPLPGGKPGPVTLSLSSGMDFPKLDHAIAVDRVASARWRSALKRGDLPSGTSATNALEWKTEAGRGVTVFSVVLHPRPSKLKREQVREYINHLWIPTADAVMADWERTAGEDDTAYRYIKYAKSFVRTKGVDKSGVWSEPAGMRLELVPQNDPTSLVPGGSLEVLLLADGKPLAHYPVALLRQAAKDPSMAVTDARGRVRISLPGAGPHMLRATTLEPSADKASKWDVHFTTITFEVRRAK